MHTAAKHLNSRRNSLTLTPSGSLVPCQPGERSPKLPLTGQHLPALLLGSAMLLVLLLLLVLSCCKPGFGPCLELPGYCAEQVACAWDTLVSTVTRIHPRDQYQHTVAPLGCRVLLPSWVCSCR